MLCLLSNTPWPWPTPAGAASAGCAEKCPERACRRHGGSEHLELHGAFSISLRAPGTESLSRFGYLAERVAQELFLGRCGVSPLGWGDFETRPADLCRRVWKLGPGRSPSPRAMCLRFVLAGPSGRAYSTGQSIALGEGTEAILRREIMKRRTFLVVAVLCVVCFLYFRKAPKHWNGAPPESTPSQRSDRRRQPRPKSAQEKADTTSTESCDALGVTCASNYFSTWKWPEAGSCALGTRNGYPVPDPRCTPGGIVANLSASLLEDPRWRTKCIRNCQSTEKQKHVTYSWYGLAAPTGNNGASQICELDHLVPLELGGADGLGNIWPQCGPDDVRLRDRYFKRKDQVENYLAAKVRAGEMSLEEAQRGIAADWTQYLDVSKAP